MAVLSDVHGVLPVLRAVLAEPDVAAADLVVVTGDHAAGPLPVQTLDALTALGDRCVLVRGNADRDLVEIRRGDDSPHPESLWAAGQLRDDQVTLLAGLPHSVTTDVEGFGSVLFCHGTPDSDVDVVLVDTPVDRWLTVTASVPAAVRTIVCGHTHMPFVRYVDGRVVLNPGSIGMPYSRPGGSWALLQDGQVSLRHTTIDLDAACSEIVARSTFPGRRAWAEEYVRAVSSDVDALRAFTPLVRP